jgi:hypothetical protein
MALLADSVPVEVVVNVGYGFHHAAPHIRSWIPVHHTLPESEQRRDPKKRMHFCWRP